MTTSNYTTKQLNDYLKEYQGHLKAANFGDKRRKQTKLDITFNKAMVTLFETELANR